MIRKTMELEASVEQAFDVFANRIGAWWPAETHSLGEARVTDVVLEPRPGGLLYEVLDNGARHEWADVLAYEPPHLISLAWRVNPERKLTHVRIRFSELEGGRTRLELEHAGWEDPDARADYDTGWDRVLATYRDNVRALAGANSSQSLLK